MNIFKRIRKLLNIEKQYEEMKDKYDIAVVKMAQQQKRIQSLENKIEKDSNSVRHDVELFNKKEKTIADLTKKLNKAYKEIRHLEATIERMKNPRV